MKQEKLGDIVSISKGKKHSIVDVPGEYSVRVIGISDLRDDNNLFYTDDNKGTEAEVGDILIAWDGANAGTIGYGKKGYIGSTIARLRINDKEKYFSPFLGIFLKTQYSYLRKSATGATIPHISRSALEGLKLPAVNYHDQVRIAEILSRAEQLIAKRRESIRLLDEYVKSVFLEMFGDPYYNYKKWPLKKLNKLCGFITKGTTPKSQDIHEDYEKGFIPFLKVYHIMDDGTINFNYRPSYINTEVHNNFLNRSKVYPDDVLMNIVGPPLGKIGIVSQECSEWNINQAIVFFRCNELLNPRYLLFVLSCENFKNAIINMAVGIRQQNLNLEQCRNIQIPLPPFDLQNRFGIIAKKVESMKGKYQESLVELENLYGALSQRAFAGDLTPRPPLHSGEGEAV